MDNSLKLYQEVKSLRQTDIVNFPHSKVRERTIQSPRQRAVIKVSVPSAIDFLYNYKQCTSCVSSSMSHLLKQKNLSTWCRKYMLLLDRNFRSTMNLSQITTKLVLTEVSSLWGIFLFGKGNVKCTCLTLVKDRFLV